MDNSILESIDAKLGALLAITVDQYLRQTGVTKPKPRSIDKTLADVGLSAQQIAKVLGKTDRVVRLQLQNDQANKARR